MLTVFAGALAAVITVNWATKPAEKMKSLADMPSIVTSDELVKAHASIMEKFEANRKTMEEVRALIKSCEVAPNAPTKGKKK